jgi:hypothetical protein
LEEQLIVKVLFCAVIAAMVLSAGTAFADYGGGDGDQSNFAYQLQQQREAYLVNQMRAWEAAHAATTRSVAQSATSPNS